MESAHGEVRGLLERPVWCTLDQRRLMALVLLKSAFLYLSLLLSFLLTVGKGRSTISLFLFLSFVLSVFLCFCVSVFLCFCLSVFLSFCVSVFQCF